MQSAEIIGGGSHCRTGDQASPDNDDPGALRTAERDAPLREPERMHWNISRTAQALGVSRNTLHRNIRRHEIALSG